VSLAFSPLLAADTEIHAVLKNIEQRYNRAKTLQVQFNEEYTVQGSAPRSESGLLTLRKPGRMRWDYTTPPGKLFVSDGREVYLYTPDSHRVEKMPLKESEDMRAPLAFLLGKLDFGKEFRDFNMKPEGGNVRITARAKTDRLPYDRIDMIIAPDSSIRTLIVNNQDQSVLTFHFDQEKLNAQVNDGQFKFQMPAGATLATPEAVR
jgi:outer membrane lipoprotein carrier protein